MENEQKNQPEKRFNAGALSATVWKNVRTGKDGKTFEARSISLERRYTDKQGQWHSSHALRITDLPKATLLLEEAYRYILLSPAKGGEALN